MYHHPSQHEGPPQPSSNRPGPTHHQQQANQEQQQSCLPPSHLPDELVSVMATRGSGDVDQCLVDLVNQPNPNQRPPPNPSQMFSSPASTVNQQPQSTHSAMGNQAQMQAPGNSGGGGVAKQDLYTPERAQSILATLGLSTEDLEILSQYPEDQLNPDNLPFLLRFLQMNKSRSQNNVASSSYSQSITCKSGSRVIHDKLPPPARSLPSTGHLQTPEVPTVFHSVPQSAGKVTDCDYVSQDSDSSSVGESMPERRHAHLQPFEPNKPVNLDYCRSSFEVHDNKQLSSAREFPPLYRPRHPDREYSRDGLKPRPSSETWNQPSSSSRHPVLKSRGTIKRLPTPTMICDFSAKPPKVYPHTCSLCEVDCEHAEDWIEHVKSLKHTDSCRDLCKNYPEWKHKLPRREHGLGQDDSQSNWSQELSPTRSISLSHSWSPSPSPPPPDKHRGGPNTQGQYRRSYQTPRHSYHRHHQDTRSSRDGLKRHHDASVKHDDSARWIPKLARRKLPSSAPMKTKLKPGFKRTKPGNDDTDKIFAKRPPAKKMKISTQSTQRAPPAECLVYLTGIPTTATEQEVKTWVRDFGKYNNVVLLSGSEADQGQTASVCMEQEEDALALAKCSSISIGDQPNVPITATLAKTPEAEADSTAVSKETSTQEQAAEGGVDSGNGPDITFNSQATLLITGLPESGWTETDVIKLCQPFGVPSTNIIVATKLGKALLLMPDAEMAEEMMKNHSITPMKINDCELNMTNLDQATSLNKPVVLYNLLNQSNKTNVPWNLLLVIRNAPDTPTASLEVLKLVERIEKVHNTLVLNHNMIICEMLTTSAVRNIKKHYHRFPCIVQSNPLYFNTGDAKYQYHLYQPRGLPASQDSVKGSPEDDIDDHTVSTADTLQDNGGGAYLEELYYDGTVIGYLCILCGSRIKFEGALSTDPIHVDAHLSGKRHRSMVAHMQQEQYVEEFNKNINLRRFYCHLCKCYINDLKSKVLHLRGKKHVAALGSVQQSHSAAMSPDAKRARKVKKDEMRDKTSEKTSRKDEAAGKAASRERKSKDKHSKVQSEEDQFQDFPDLMDFVTVDEVGDVTDFPSNPPDAVAMDTTESAANDKDHSMPTAVEEEKCALGGQKKDLKMDNRIADGDVRISNEDEEAKDEHLKERRHSLRPSGEKSEVSPADDKDSHTVPNGDEEEDSTPQQNGKHDYLVDICYDGTAIDFFCTICESTLNSRDTKFIETHMNGKQHNKLLSLYMHIVKKREDKKIEIFSEDQCIVERPKSSNYYCSLCKCSIKYVRNYNFKFEHLKGVKHAASLWKKMKLKDDTDEKNGEEDEAAGKDQVTEVGEELSSASPTRVCNPEVPIKSLTMQPGEDKMNSGLKETKSSSSTSGDGEVSSCKSAGLELTKVEPEEDPFQDFPFDMADFVTVDEVGDVPDIPVHPPPPAVVATDATATMEETGDECNFSSFPSPPPPTVDNSEPTEEKSTEQQQHTSETEDTPQAETAVLDNYEAPATTSENPACVESTLGPVATTEHPHSPVALAMGSSDQLDTPMPQPVAANVDSTLLHDSLTASAPAMAARSPESSTSPNVEVCSSTVDPTAGGEQENQGPDTHSQPVKLVAEKVELEKQGQKNKGKMAASVSVKRRMPKQEEPMQKKQKAQDKPSFDLNSVVGMEFLVPKTGFFCKLCNRFFTGGRESELKHCRSQNHHDNWQKYLKSKKTTSR